MKGEQERENADTVHSVYSYKNEKNKQCNRQMKHVETERDTVQYWNFRQTIKSVTDNMYKMKKRAEFNTNFNKSKSVFQT